MGSEIRILTLSTQRNISDRDNCNIKCIVIIRGIKRYDMNVEGLNKSFQRTVDGDSNALGKSKAVLADEGRDLAELVGREVLAAGVGGVGLNKVELEVVGLCNRLDGSGAGVILMANSFSQSTSSIQTRVVLKM